MSDRVSGLSQAKDPHETSDRTPPFPARDMALKLLDDLCEDALELPLDVVVRAPRTPNEGHIASKYRWLHDLIVAGIKE